MKKLSTLLVMLLIQQAVFAQKTYVYFQNSTHLDFTVSSTQTGTHTLESSEWWSGTATVNAWQNETNVLWTNRDAGIHWGDFFYLTTTLSSTEFSVDLKIQLEGNFVGSTIWSAASGPGFDHSWSSDNNFHSEIFTVNGKQYQLKYTFYFTGGYDDILFTLHEYDAFTADPVELNDPDIMNVLAYNTYMLTPPIALSDQGTRAQHIDDAVHNLDAILIQEVFDNSARATLKSELAAEYPYQTAVVDLPNILEDGGIMIASRWPIEYEAQMTWNNCNEPDCLANKGVMYARINKLGRKYHLFSTHQQAFNGSDDVVVRNLQMQQFQEFINAQNIPANEAVIFGGDMNVDKYTNKQGEYDNMLSIFNASEPTYTGHPYTWDKYSNDYIDLGVEAPEYLDYVLTDNDYLVPTSQSNEVWVLRSNHDDMWNIHDLSDHFGVLGRFVYPSAPDICASTTIAIETNIIDESFAGAGDGIIDITVGGGTTPYSYSWSNGSSIEDLSGLTPGIYSVTVTDANGCSETTTATIETNSNCTAATASFSTNPLSHSGAGNSATTLFLPAGSNDISFAISDIGQKTGGKASRRYVELVTVSYVDNLGNSNTFGTYSGANTSSANINISGGVQSISIQLEDVYDGNTSSTMSVLMSVVDYCAGGPPCADTDGDGVCDSEDACPGLDDALSGTSCNDGDDCTENDVYDVNCNCSGTFADSDGDGVCDANDICPGGDDNIDADNNGVPDFCDGGTCSTTTGAFPANPLTHSGTGSDATTITLPAGSSDVDFSISSLGSKTNGKGSGRYIDLVTVSYIDGSGSTQAYGTYSGGNNSTVSIPGAVQSVSVSLADGYDGNSSVTQSINFSDVSYCVPSVRVASNKTVPSRMISDIDIYPNPVRDQLQVNWKQTDTETITLDVYAMDGQTILTQRIKESDQFRLDVSALNTGIYVIRMQNESGEVQSVKFVKQ